MTEGEHNATHNGRGTDQTSDEIQCSSDNTEGESHITHSTIGTSETTSETEDSGVYYKMFLFNIFHLKLFDKYG